MILAGDIVIGQRAARLDLGDPLVLANLEGPVLPTGASLTPAPKAGSSLHSSQLPVTASRMIVSLANNHLMDYGPQGLAHTQTALQQAKWTGVGAGHHLAQARQPIFVQEQGVRIAIIACTEAQFGLAQANHPGVAELGPWIYSAIAQARTRADAVIVSVHAAVEMSPWPAPYWRDLYRSWIDAGADVVHGHHAHVPQGYEEHGRGLILYGLGNLLVDPTGWASDPNTRWSLAVRVDWSIGPRSFQVIPVQIQEQGSTLTVQAMPELRRRELDAYLQDIQSPLTNDALLQALWQETALRCYADHYARYLQHTPPSNPGHSVNLKSLLCRWIVQPLTAQPAQVSPAVLPSFDLLLGHVLFACESHRQAIATATGLLTGLYPDRRTDQSRRLADRYLPWSISSSRSLRTPATLKEAA